MRSVRLASLVFMGASLSLGVSACGNDSSSGSTTSPSVVAADATTSESFTTTVPVGGTVFYSFSIAQYGNVAVTLTAINGPDLPDGLTLTIGIGRPGGTSCTTSSTVSAGAGDSPQLTGTYGPGVFCVSIADAGVLTSPVSVTAAVAHS
jgi:hypothetical protein